MKNIRVEIRPSVVLWTIGIILLLVAGYYLSGVILLFFAAFIISSGFRPTVDKLYRKRVPREFSVAILYLAFFVFLSFILLITISTFIDQFNLFISDLPNIVRNVLEFVSQKLPQDWGVLTNSDINNIVSNLRFENVNLTTLKSIFEFLSTNFSINSLGVTSLGFISSITNAVFTGFLVMMIAAYLLIRKDSVYDSLEDFIPNKYQERLKNMYLRIEKGLGEWLVGQIILMLIIGIASYVLLMIPSVLGVDGYSLDKFALLIAIIAGLLEALPNVGPAITLFLTLLLALGSGSGFVIMIYIAIVFTGLQQMEAIFIVPKVMKKAVDLDPIITILAIAGGAQLGGLIGAILAIPLVVVIKIGIEELNKTIKSRGDRLGEDVDFENEEVGTPSRLEGLKNFAKRLGLNI